jgi:thiol-disulfide isomerase/thioredoxin
MSGVFSRWATRAALSGATIVAIAVAFVFARESFWQIRAPSAVVLEPAQPSAAVAGREPTGLTDFAFLDKPRALPELRFVNAAGEKRSLAAFHGHPLVLNIWATWCVPCRKEMPTLDRLQARLAWTDALVVPLSIDSQGPSAVKAFYAEIGIKSLGVYVDPSGDASRLLHVVGIPTTLLVDRAGREIGRKLGPAEWDSTEMVGLIRNHLDPRSMREATGQR